MHETVKSIKYCFNKNTVADVSLFNNYFVFTCNPDREILYKKCNKCYSYLMNEAGITEVNNKPIF